MAKTKKKKEQENLNQFWDMIMDSGMVMYTWSKDNAITIAMQAQTVAEAQAIHRSQKLLVVAGTDN